MKTESMKTATIVFVLLIYISASAQKISPLKIGDVVPDIEFKLLNTDKPTVKLSDYKGKLVILDFWATWCGACKGGFPRADSLQKVFGDKVQILLVNSSNRTKPDSKGKLDTFYRKWMERFPEFKLPIAYEDTIAYKLFLHSGIPHYVWIGEDGRVKAITSKTSVTAGNVAKFLKGDDMQLPVKGGYALDVIYIDGVSPILVNQFDNYSFYKKGKLDTVNSVNEVWGKRDSSGKNFQITRVLLRNQPLLEIYKIAIDRGIPLKRYNSKRVLFEVKNSSKLLNELHTYDLVVPRGNQERLYQIMIDELNRYTDYSAGMENRKMKCLVLIRSSKEDKLKARDRKFGVKLRETDTLKYMYNEELSYLVKDLEKRKGIKMPVLDETGYTGNVDMEFNYYGDHIQKLRKELQKYDLDLIEAEREVEMFVIKDKVQPTIKTTKQ